MLVGQRCMACHGIVLVAAGVAPDLRTSPMVLDAAAFKQVVQQGVLTANGMPSFKELRALDIEAIRQYIRREAAFLRLKGS